MQNGENMKVEKRIKRLESGLKAACSDLQRLVDHVNNQADAINKLEATVNGGMSYLSFGDQEPKTRIDRALEENAGLQMKLNTLCESLGVIIRGRDEMPAYDVQLIPEKEKEKKPVPEL